jgi:hypothetical protein
MGWVSRHQLNDLQAQIDQLQLYIAEMHGSLVVRDPGSAMSANAYDGLRKAVMAGAKARTAHLAQLAHLAEAVDRGSDQETMRSLVEEWMLQAGVRQVVDGPAEAYEVLEGSGEMLQVLSPAWVDEQTGRIVKRGTARRIPAPPRVTPAPPQGHPGMPRAAQPEALESGAHASPTTPPAGAAPAPSSPPPPQQQPEQEQAAAVNEEGSSTKAETPPATDTGDTHSETRTTAGPDAATSTEAGQPAADPQAARGAAPTEASDTAESTPSAESSDHNRSTDEERK